MVIICQRLFSRNETISAAEGQSLAAMTVTTLTKMRDAEQYDLFWQLILKNHLH